MNRHRLMGTASLVLMLLCFTPALAQNQPSESGTKKTESSQKSDEAKEKERKEKARKDEEARLEAAKRKQVEQQNRRESDEAKAKEESARRDEERKAQERKDQERKDQERKEIERKEQDRKDEARKHDEQRKEDDRKKEEQRKNDEERRKKEEARLEAQKRREIEREEARRRQRARHDHAPPSADYSYQPSAPQETVVIIAPQPVVDNTTVSSGSSSGSVQAGSNAAGTAQANSAGAAAPTVTASTPTAPVHTDRYYRQPPARRAWVSVLCAPEGAGGKPAVGFQYLTNKNYGVGVWFSGSFGQDDDVIDGTIPHNDYYTESRTGTMGLEALCCIGSDAAMLVFGAGVSVDETTRTDISNATGWKWDGGSSTLVRPAAQVGCRFRLGGRVSLQFGYDTAQSGFFGLSAGF